MEDKDKLRNELEELAKKAKEYMDSLKEESEETITEVKNTVKKFDPEKFKKGFSLLDPEGWGKRLVQEADLKTWTIRCLIGLVIFGIYTGYIYWKGKSTNPITIDCKQLEDKTFKLEAPARGIYSLEFKNGQMFYNGKPVKAGQVPELKPYGASFQPILLAAYGIHGKSIGLGAELLYFYNVNLDVYAATDKSANIGLSYDLKQFSNWLQNSSLGFSYGKILDTGETTYKTYFKLKF